MLVICNFTKELQAVTMPEVFEKNGCEVLISNYGRDNGKTQELYPYEALVLYYKSEV